MDVASCSSLHWFAADSSCEARDRSYTGPARQRVGRPLCWRAKHGRTGGVPFPHVASGGPQPHATTTSRRQPLQLLLQLQLQHAGVPCARRCRRHACPSPLPPACLAPKVVVVMIISVPPRSLAATGAGPRDRVPGGGQAELAAAAEDVREGAGVQQVAQVGHRHPCEEGAPAAVCSNQVRPSCGAYNCVCHYES